MKQTLNNGDGSSHGTQRAKINENFTELYEAIAAATPLLQTQTIAYVDRITAVGGYLDSSTIAAVDNFFVTGKANGWLTLLKDVWCPLGNNLASALVKMVVASGTSSNMVNSAVTGSTVFQEADYSQRMGLGDNNNQTAKKYLKTGLIPSTIGLTHEDVSFGLLQTDIAAAGGWGLGLTPTAGGASSNIFIGASDCGSITGGYYIQGHPGTGIKAASFKSAKFNINYDGVTAGGNNTNSATLIGSPLDTELTYFKSVLAGNPSIFSGKVGFAFIGLGLTKEQLASLCNAAMELNYAVGRLTQTGSRIGFIGDSNTSGYNLPDGSQKFSTITAKLLGGGDINFGTSNSRLRTSTTQAVSLFDRYNEVTKVVMNTIISMYGSNDMAQAGADGTTNGDDTMVADFKAKYITIIAAWKAAGLRVVILSPPWLSSTSYNVNDTKIMKYVTAAYEAAADQNVLFIDTYHLFLDTGVPATFFQSDGIHLNLSGSLKLSKAIASAFGNQLFRQVTVDFPAITAGSYSDITLTLFGATLNSSIAIGLVSAPTAGIMYQAFVSAVNTVTIRATNIFGATIDPASQEIRVTCFL